MSIDEIINELNEDLGEGIATYADAFIACDIWADEGKITSYEGPDGGGCSFLDLSKVKGCPTLDVVLLDGERRSIGVHAGVWKVL